MVNMHIVPPSDWEILKKYLDAPGVVLVSEEMFSEMYDEDIEVLRANEGEIYYDFGGEADVFVELVDNTEHYALEEIIG